MSIIKLDTWLNADCTLGRLSYGEFKCFTLELPDLDNQQDISCIPAGRYRVTKYESPSKGSVLLLHNVVNRTYIEIHAGNFTRQILGCILVGRAIKYLDGDSIPDVSHSKDALNALLSVVPDETEIVVTRR